MLTNLQEVDQEEAFNLIKFFIWSHQNMFLFGRRGTGKTQLILDAIQACNYKVNYINLSVVERSDLAGYPDIFSEGDIVKFKSPYFLSKLSENCKPDTVLVFDEIDKASPDVTAPLLEILQFKRINGKPLNIVSCILTSNLINEQAYSNYISSALLDRGAKYVLSFQFDKWLDWAKSNQIHDLILGFLQHNPQLACGDINQDQYASPSPRGWQLTSDALYKAKELKIVDSNSIYNIVSGFVGKEAGIKFKIWYEHYKKFDSFVHSLIELGQLQLDFGNLMPTEKTIFVISACHLAKQKVIQDISKSNKNKFLFLENLCNFFITQKVDLELQILGLSNSFSFDMITRHKLYSCKVFFEHFTKLNEKINFKNKGT